jgi:5,8-dihydroxy-2-naphthoate synthase
LSESSAKVLAVTDDLIFRSRIGVSLGREGIAVQFVAADRLEDAARENRPNLILLDYSAGGGAALAVLARMMESAATKSIPILAYGPHMDLPARERARAEGADEVLSNNEVATNLPALVRRWTIAPSETANVTHGKTTSDSFSRTRTDADVAGPGIPRSAESASNRSMTGRFTPAAPTVLRLGHSPDPDDAFMFYPLAHGLLDTGGLQFEQVLRDIETLNRMALDGDIEITAASVHAYGHLAERYAILPCGGSFGDGYGPLLVSREPMTAADLPGKLVAVPGTLTSAFLALRLFAGEIRHTVVPFDRIPDAVSSGLCDVGLLIHEGQLTYRGAGLHLLADLGEWWKTMTDLPLPLGVNLVRKDLGTERCRQVSRILRKAIDYSLAHRPEALKYAMEFGRGLERDLTDRFVGMYVNDLTLDAGSRGRRAIAEFLDRGHKIGLLPSPVVPEFVSD